MLPVSVIAFTHKTIPLERLGMFFLDEGERKSRLEALRTATGIEELFYLSTCNRVEFVFSSSATPTRSFLEKFFRAFGSGWSSDELEFAVSHAAVYDGVHAVRRLMEVASSLDSMVVGEREIITQVRNAYEHSRDAGLTGDLLRLVTRNVINTAKKVFTDTGIADNPVSVVSLAFRKLRALKVSSDARFIIIGAGETSSNLLKYLAKHGYKRFAVFNRTLSKAQTLADKLSASGSDAVAYPLTELSAYSGGFDVLISCTGAPEPVVTKNVYTSLLKDSGQKTLIDLAQPADIAADVVSAFPVHYIGLSQLSDEAERNLLARRGEMEAAERIIDGGVEEFLKQLRTRRLELKMRTVPEKIREIKNKAVTDVFAKDIEAMDEHSREVLARVLDYMEKKYISVPMVMAKEIILE